MRQIYKEPTKLPDYYVFIQMSRVILTVIAASMVILA